MFSQHILLAASFALFIPSFAEAAGTRLYWFVPDGLRADPKVFDVFGWAQEGKLPNIKRMMDQGAWGYSMPTFPSHTPVNFATLMTGAYPEKHGVTDGPMRVEGFSLEKPSVNGFSSTAKKVETIWRTLEKAGLRVALISIPGSTPPELDSGATVRGRWGNWGADFHALNFQSAKGADSRSSGGLGSRLFYQGPELTRDVPMRTASGWSKAFSSRASAREMAILAYGTTFYAYVGGEGETRSLRNAFVSFSMDKKMPVARLTRTNEWSPWLPITLTWRGQRIESSVRVCLIRLSPDGFVKVRLLFDVLNRTITQPPGLAETLRRAVGPMVDFPDNWPAQLNQLPEERDVLLTEAHMALEWHKGVAARLLSVEKPDVLIQDTYVPNQILESRWWLRHIDPDAPDYLSTDPAEREKRRAEILGVYQGIDAILGKAMSSADPDAVFVLSSDHGILPIKKEVRLNNLLAREGLLFFDVNLQTGEPMIDWARSKAIFLKMIGVYVNPSGLAGPLKRGSGAEYDALRRRVADVISGLKDNTAPVVEKIVPWERAGELRLPGNRVPDLVLAMMPGYALTEDMDKSGDVLRFSRQSGYKQAVLADGRASLWTPFVIMGPGVKKGFRLKTPIHNADQNPTLLTLLGIPIPSFVQGRVLNEILEKPR